MIFFKTKPAEGYPKAAPTEAARNPFSVLSGGGVPMQPPGYALVGPGRGCPPGQNCVRWWCGPPCPPGQCCWICTECPWPETVRVRPASSIQVDFAGPGAQQNPGMAFPGGFVAVPRQLGRMDVILRVDVRRLAALAPGGPRTYDYVATIDGMRVVGPAENIRIFGVVFDVVFSNVPPGTYRGSIVVGVNTQGMRFECTESFSLRHTAAQATIVPILMTTIRCVGAGPAPRPGAALAGAQAGVMGDQIQVLSPLGRPRPTAPSSLAEVLD